MAQKFRKASFRGVEFFLAEDSAKFGRRFVSHEFPQREKPSSEDLGRKAQEFSIEGYVVGDNANDERDRLIEACETAGPGVLIHPHYGQKNVICTDCTPKNSSSEKRIARFTLSFTETDTAPFPTARVDQVSATAIASDGLISASKTNFASKFSTLGKPAFVAQSAISKIKGAAAKLKSMQGNVSGVVNTAADFSNSVRTLETGAVDLVRNPKKLADQIASSFELVLKTFSSIPRLGNIAQRQLSSSFNFGADDKPIPLTTSTRVQEDVNRVALNNLIRQIAVANAAKNAVSTVYTSADEAKETREILFDTIDDLELTAEDEVYQALRALRSRISQSITVSGPDLRPVHRIETQSLTNSIVLVYSLFGTLELESDLIARNNIRHPGFIVGGTKLEVLSE